jgi:alpha-D-ribose 1-methylphosphonate 5-triphosphate diphosphatase
MPVLSGASLVLRDDIVRADLHIEDGLIAAIGERPAGAALIDCSDCCILPGLVDLHTDNVERHVEPRPGTFWAAEHAVMAHDAELAGAGITTAFDAITLGGGFAEERRQASSLRVIEALGAARGANLLRIDHRLHLRCELSDAALPDIIAKVADVSPQIVSLMNHTPGQRQWRNLDKFRAHYARRYGLSEAELNALIATRQGSETTIVPANRRQAIATSRRPQQAGAFCRSFPRRRWPPRMPPRVGLPWWRAPPTWFAARRTRGTWPRPRWPTTAMSTFCRPITARRAYSRQYSCSRTISGGP